MDYEKFWYNSPKDLFRADNYLHIIPNNVMTMDQKLNAIFRFSIYFAGVLVVLRQDLYPVIFPCIVGAVTIVIHNAHINAKAGIGARQGPTEVFDNLTKQPCTRPTKENPFMNVMLDEYTERPDRPPACDVSNTTVRNKVKQMFEEDLFRDVEDVFARQASDRQFYTMPVTTIPNNQSEYAEWLYGNTGKIRDSYGFLKA